MNRFEACAVGVALLLSGIAVACSGDTWEGYVYPDKTDLIDSRSVGTFDSLEGCRAAAREELQRLNAETTGDYECGKNCRSESGIRVCEETLR